MRIIYFAILLLFLSCSQNQQSGVEYLKELSSEVVSCTTEAEYDKVYEKIIALKDDVRFKNNKADIAENSEIVKRMIVLTEEALAVKAILYVMPATVTPKSQDMRSLVDECINNKINVRTWPYNDVRAIVYNYYNISE